MEMKTYFLEDRVEVQFLLRTPYGYPDEQREFNIAYDSIDQLPKAKAFDHPAIEEYVFLFLPQVQREVVFILTTYPSGGSTEEVISGPYQPKEVLKQKR